MKKLLLIIGVCIFALSLNAQNLDYRQVIFGNNYEAIKEISAEAFFAEYPQTKNRYDYTNPGINWTSYIVRWEKSSLNQSGYTSVTTKEEKEYVRVYEQSIGDSVFYRVLRSNEELTDENLLVWHERYFEQQLFLKLDEEKLLYLNVYLFGSDVAFEHGADPGYANVEIIARNNKVLGIMRYYYNKLYPRGGGEQIYHVASYYRYEDLLKYREKKTDLLDTVDFMSKGKISPIVIEASAPLIDSKRPFMYTIQNAFDGNPSTSYVEDTKDDLFTLVLRFTNPFVISSFLMVNGYAATPVLFQNNNRLKTLYLNYALETNKQSDWDYLAKFVENIKITDTATNQKFDFSPLEFSMIGLSARTLIKGNKYTDTCLSELDFYTKEVGWLFGGNNE